MGNETRKKRLAAGICPRCDLPCELGKTMCVDHLDKEAQRVRQSRDKKLGDGACGTCGVNPLVKGRGQCETCLISKRTSMKALTKTRRLLGLCIYCGRSATGQWCVPRVCR